MKYYYIKPIQVSWVWKYGAWKSWFTWHGWQIGTAYEGSWPEVSYPRIFAWTYHLGPIKIKFGALSVGVRAGEESDV